MLNKLRTASQAFFTLNKREQKGSFLLLVLILLATAVYFLLPQLVQPRNTDFGEFEQQIASFTTAQQQIFDSIYIERLQNSGRLDSNLARKKIKPFPFNPNNLPAERWRTLGLTNKQIQTIKNFEAKGGQFRKKGDLKKIYSISATEYEILAPYIRLPSKDKVATAKGGEKKKSKTKTFTLVEINTADSVSLVADLKLPPWLAARTIKYRNLLGGFYEINQLAEVYGFDSVSLSKRKHALCIDTTFIQKLDLNKAGFKQMVHHPYISYELTKWIVNTRQAIGGFRSVQELEESPLVPPPLFGKLRPYLVVGKKHEQAIQN